MVYNLAMNIKLNAKQLRKWTGGPRRGRQQATVKHNEIYIILDNVLGVLYNIGSVFRLADARIQMYSQELADKNYGQGVRGPSKEQYDEANPQPEPMPASLLARVFYTENGSIFIPEEEAP